MNHLELNDIRSKNVDARYNEIKSLLKIKKGVDLSNLELAVFIKYCMKLGDLQIWILDKKIKGSYLSDLDINEKFLSLQTNEQIVDKYEEFINAPKEEPKDIKKRYLKRK